jgi:hypothetical protein
MARHSFGGDQTGWAFTVAAGNVPVLAAGVVITCWTAFSGRAGRRSAVPARPTS